MFGKFLPKNISFFDDFEKHASLIAQSSQELLAIVTTSTDIPKRAQRIAFLEKEADLVAHHCIQNLHKTFITPFDREDIYKFITQLDDIIDHIEDIAACILLYKLNAMTPEIKTLANVISVATQEVQKIAYSLRKLDDIDALRQMFQRVHDCEHEADNILRTAIATLFEQEKDPITLIKWKEIYELLEDTTDCCQDVANTAEGILIEHL